MKFYNFERFGIRLIYLKGSAHHTNIIDIKVGKLKKQIRFKRFDYKQAKQRLSKKATYLVDVLTRRTIYMYEYGTDCDGVSSGNSVKYKNIFVAKKEIDDAYDWADGPLSFTRLTKKEYEEAESYYRDHGAEAFENGHSHVWHV